MSDSWYYAASEGRVGPLNLRQLKTTLSTLPDAKDVLVWRNGLPDWKRARDLPELRRPGFQAGEKSHRNARRPKSNERLDMTTPRRVEANRANARKSTGPRTRQGKARAARSARRHGLSIPVLADSSLSKKVDELAHKIVGRGASPGRLEYARRVAAQS
jgi:hypothetical protein